MQLLEQLARDWETRQGVYSVEHVGEEEGGLLWVALRSPCDFW